MIRRAPAVLATLLARPRHPRRVRGGSPWGARARVVASALASLPACDAAPARDPDLTLVAHEWWWEARYPGGLVSGGEPRVPAGHPLVVRLEAADVAHRLRIPALGVDVSATPGHPAQVQIRALSPGALAAGCAVPCEGERGAMRLAIGVEEPPAFEAWRDRQARPAQHAKLGQAARGEAVFLASTCPRCHAIAGLTPPVRLAPDLTHLAGRTTLAGGALTNDAQGLDRWLRDPQAVKPGCHMPVLAIPDDDRGALVSFLRGLE